MGYAGSLTEYYDLGLSDMPRNSRINVLLPRLIHMGEWLNWAKYYGKDLGNFSSCCNNKKRFPRSEGYRYFITTRVKEWLLRHHDVAVLQPVISRLKSPPPERDSPVHYVEPERCAVGTSYPSLSIFPPKPGKCLPLSATVMEQEK